MDCRDALAKLYDYIDGEIGPSEREAIAAHVDACRPCFDHFETERLFTSVITERAPRFEIRAEFKSHLLARIAEESHSQGRRSPSSTSIIPLLARFAIAAGLVLAIGVGAAWVEHQAGPQRLSWRTLANYHHDLVKVDEVGIDTDDYSQARAFLVAQMNPGVATLVPASAPTGCPLHECCVMPWQDGKLGKLALNAGLADGISVFVIPAASFQLSDEPHIHVAGRDYRSVKLGCCRAVCWDDGSGYVCVMIGDCGTTDLLAYAEAWKSPHDAPASGGYLLPVTSSSYAFKAPSSR